MSRISEKIQKDPDGLYLFFGAGGDISWVSTKIIADLKSLAEKK